MALLISFVKSKIMIFLAMMMIFGFAAAFVVEEVAADLPGTQPHRVPPHHSSAHSSTIGTYTFVAPTVTDTRFNHPSMTPCPPEVPGNTLSRLGCRATEVPIVLLEPIKDTMSEEDVVRMVNEIVMPDMYAHGNSDNLVDVTLDSYGSKTFATPYTFKVPIETYGTPSAPHATKVARSVSVETPGMDIIVTVTSSGDLNSGWVDVSTEGPSMTASEMSMPTWTSSWTEEAAMATPQHVHSTSTSAPAGDAVMATSQVLNTTSTSTSTGKATMAISQIPISTWTSYTTEEAPTSTLSGAPTEEATMAAGTQSNATTSSVRWSNGTMSSMNMASTSSHHVTAVSVTVKSTVAATSTMPPTTMLPSPIYSSGAASNKKSSPLMMICLLFAVFFVMPSIAFMPSYGTTATTHGGVDLDTVVVPAVSVAPCTDNASYLCQGTASLGLIAAPPSAGTSVTQSSSSWSTTISATSTATSTSTTTHWSSSTVSSTSQSTSTDGGHHTTSVVKSTSTAEGSTSLSTEVSTISSTPSSVISSAATSTPTKNAASGAIRPLKLFKVINVMFGLFSLGSAHEGHETSAITSYVTTVISTTSTQTHASATPCAMDPDHMCPVQTATALTGTSDSAAPHTTSTLKVHCFDAVVSTMTSGSITALTTVSPYYCSEDTWNSGTHTTTTTSMLTPNATVTVTSMVSAGTTTTLSSVAAGMTVRPAYPFIVLGRLLNGARASTTPASPSTGTIVYPGGSNYTNPYTPVQPTKQPVHSGVGKVIAKPFVVIAVIFGSLIFCCRPRVSDVQRSLTPVTIARDSKEYEILEPPVRLNPASMSAVSIPMSVAEPEVWRGDSTTKCFH